MQYNEVEKEKVNWSDDEGEGAYEQFQEAQVKKAEKSGCEYSDGQGNRE